MIFPIMVRQLLLTVVPAVSFNSFFSQQVALVVVIVLCVCPPTFEHIILTYTVQTHLYKIFLTSIWCPADTEWAGQALKCTQRQKCEEVYEYF